MSTWIVELEKPKVKKKERDRGRKHKWSYVRIIRVQPKETRAREVTVVQTAKKGQHLDWGMGLKNKVQ